MTSASGLAARNLVEDLSRQGSPVPEDLLLAMVVDDAMREAVSGVQRVMRDGSLQEDVVLGLPYLVSDLEAAGVVNIEAWLSEVKTRAGDVAAYKDLWVEAHFGLTLAQNGFKVTFKPFPSGGPDLLAAVTAKDIYIEIRTLRESPSGANSRRRLATAIIEKHRQQKVVPAEAAYLVLARSTTTAIEDIEFDMVTGALEEEARRGGAEYEGIGAVLFYDGWRNMQTGRRWYLWRNPSALPDRRIPDEVAHVLENLSLPATHPKPPQLKGGSS